MYIQVKTWHAAACEMPTFAFEADTRETAPAATTVNCHMDRIQLQINCCMSCWTVNVAIWKPCPNAWCATLCATKITRLTKLQHIRREKYTTLRDVLHTINGEKDKDSTRRQSNGVVAHFLCTPGVRSCQWFAPYFLDCAPFSAEYLEESLLLQ